MNAVAIISVLTGYSEKVVEEEWNTPGFKRWHSKARQFLDLFEKVSGQRREEDIRHAYNAEVM